MQVVNTKKDILIKKASGDEEPFSSEKLERSLINAGADHDIIDKIVSDIRNWIVPGISTKKIYTRAFALLRKERKTTAIRYRLKQAILELGPTGYPFEALIGELFERQGFTTEVGIVLEGQCVTHEMDVIATKNKEQHLVECKYHKDQGKQESVQVPLYVRSRVNDIVSKRQSMQEYKDYSFTGWVITNTRFSSDSTQYGSCAGLRMLAWDYPHEAGLKDILEKLKLYPITILNHLTIAQKQSLLEAGIVTCSHALENPEFIQRIGLSKPKFSSLMNELHEFCG